MAETLATKLLRFAPIRFDRIAPKLDVNLDRLVELPPGFHAINPSVVQMDEHFLICIRGVNYLKGPLGAPPSFTVGDRYMTRNRFILVDHNFRLKHDFPGLGDSFDDIEDIKLFRYHDRIMGIGSAPSDRDELHGRSIVLLDINDVRDRGSRRTVSSPFRLRQEKNWCPFVYQGDLHFIYSFSPLVILRYNEADGTTGLVGSKNQQIPKPNFRFLVSGSSAGLPISGGFIFAAHRRGRTLPQRTFTYLSRIYRLRMPSMQLTAGPYFSIGEPGIQFINGLEEFEDDLIVTYGKFDLHANVTRFPKKLVLPI